MSKKSEKAEKTPAVEEIERLTSLREHPNSGPAIRRARAIGGLCGFAVAAFVGFESGTPFATTMERALEVGLASQVVVWAGAVLVWKRLLIAQAGVIGRSRRERLNAAIAKNKPTGAGIE